MVKHLEEVFFAPGVGLSLKEGVFAWMKGIGSKVSGFVLRDSWSLEPGDSRYRRRTLVPRTCQGPENVLLHRSELSEEGVLVYSGVPSWRGRRRLLDV